MRDKTDLPTTESSENSLPFFARFLEGQETSKDSFMTLKYPSDRDEDDMKHPFANNGQQ